MSTTDCSDKRVRVSGKFFRSAAEKWYARGFCYGPFAPNRDGDFLPEPLQVRADFAHIRRLGGNCVRVFYPPPAWLLDEAAATDLRVFIDIPWEKHRCFFEDWEALERARKRVRETAREQGSRPEVFAISVANEIPVDIIRYYGRKRVGRFVGELLDSVKQEAPECLATYVNFPTTEFFDPASVDFYCFNVYVHAEQKLGVYLDRLQHIAGNKPLILGEYGIDTIREGDVEQAELLSRHVRQVFRRGLAGSFIFSYTDDWFTSGRQIEDWAFGVTQRDRTEKLAAKSLAKAWRSLPQVESRAHPRVSVVVCSYNGAATLRECLDSLMRLEYPDYEVVLVDDGSTDETRTIAKDYPQVFYHHQSNHGLSVARNVGARLASGEIIAYTDSDCVADELWLTYLVQVMQDQNVEAIGGPNVTPVSDGWIAKCIAASPGNPSHVMLDDQHAEHVPGCNLAIRRNTLLGMGGFDPQFRQAGDDVDICWRILDADLPIGYAPGAMVWHHRRATVSAFIKQQRGYGRSEAMVHFKHPQRCSNLGRSCWRGIIYGDGAVGLPLMPDTIYHGHFGGGLFQTIYRHNDYGAWAVMTSLEWHLLAAFLLALATLYWPLSLASIVMWLAPLLLAARSAATAPVEKGAPRWFRPMVATLYFIQPIVRGFYRMTYLLSNKRLPRMHVEPGTDSSAAKRISATEMDLYWQSEQATGRERLLEALVNIAKRMGWYGDFGNAWADWDVKLVGDRWHDIVIRTATEELGWPKRFTRARCTVRNTRFSGIVATTSAVWAIAAAAAGQRWAIAIGLVACAWTFASIGLSRRRCLNAVSALVARAGQRCGLASVTLGAVVPGANGKAGSESTSTKPVAGRSTTPRTANDDSGIVRV
jgi:glycosyltransferase involved in cell wall biosynthesis